MHICPSHTDYDIYPYTNGQIDTSTPSLLLHPLACLRLQIVHIMSTTATSSSFTGWPAINMNKKGKAKGNHHYYQPPTPTLSLQELAPGLFLVPDVFTQQQCRTMIQAAEVSTLLFVFTCNPFIFSGGALISNNTTFN